jgi:REP element-mobilizing transposase RayT
MARGIDGFTIFEHDSERRFFISLLGSILEKTESRCLAWALMHNHYHLLVRPGDTLEKLMRPLNSRYAQWFNRRRDRKGYLFQDRYRSIVCHDIGYAEELVRYIHLNPIRAGIVSSLDELRGYPWCGHKAMMGGRGVLPRHDVAETLRYFGPDIGEARREYLAFLRAGIEEGTIGKTETVMAMFTPDGEQEAEEGERGLSLPGVIGDAAFVRRALSERSDRVNRQRRLRARGWTVKRVVEYVSAKLECRPADVFSRGRSDSRSELRALVAWLSIHELGLSSAEVARYIGISPAAVSSSLTRGRQKAAGRKLNKLPPSPLSHD